MNTLWNILILIGSFVGMELFSWWFHKYVMHGWLWFIHKTHHEKQHTPWELNDIFSLGFGSIAVILILVGFEGFTYPFWIGAGITSYGMVYFILHDLFIHRRLELKPPFKGKYIEGITHAHRMHHKHRTKSEGESFGLLWVAQKYYDNRQKKEDI